MRFKNKENMLLGGIIVGLGVVGFAINYIKARNVDKRVDSLGDHVNKNFNEFAETYNRFIDFQDETYKDITDSLEDIKEEVGACYEHIEVLSNKLDKEDKVEQECNEVI